jgi:peptidyl-tRNA hydrolase, PTH1 family
VKAVFGLGNPGRKYLGTRHNIGFMALDRLCTLQNCRFTLSLSCDCWLARIREPEVVLIKPRTYMNVSGGCAAKIVRKYKLSANDFLAVCDDADLELGVLRLRQNGSAGGHRGLQSIIESLGSQDFCRLRLGIGRDAGLDDLADYVLEEFPSKQREQLDSVLEEATGACLEWINAGPASAMNKYNKRLKIVD